MSDWMVVVLAGGGGGVLGALAVMEVRYRIYMWKYKRELGVTASQMRVADRRSAIRPVVFDDADCPDCDGKH